MVMAGEGAYPAFGGLDPARHRLNGALWSKNKQTFGGAAPPSVILPIAAVQAAITARAKPDSQRRRKRSKMVSRRVDVSSPATGTR